MSRDKAQQKSGHDELFPVVGIGASAGGLDALKIFLQSLRPKPGMAFVFIQHLSPSHVSILPEILERISPIPVQHITDRVHIEPDFLYIVPENKVVTAADGVLRLESRSDDQKKNDTIDLFFSSLGVVHQSYAVGIVLSGALNDGTAGLQVIKSYGGLTFAQDGGSAAFNSMPNSAVKAGVIDFILPPGKIAQRLVAMNSPFHAGKTEDDIFKQILTVLRVRRGVNFQHYKSSTLKRRIIRRMALSKTEQPTDYLTLLRESKGEQDALYNDMLISVTSFFRDPAVFELLSDELLPKIIQEKNNGTEPIRIWIAGCATGEEAYSMAICLQELIENKTPDFKLQIFATDVSEAAIVKARSGIYKVAELEGLSDERIQQYFTKTANGYQVNKKIRDHCVFAQHNLLKDPPFSRIDLLSCRNVMIYLEPVLQNKVLMTFHYALNNEGYLLLGKSETVGRHGDSFAAYKPAEKIYQRKGPAGRYRNVASYERESTFRQINIELREEEAEKDIYKLAEEAMLAHLTPPCVLINEKYDIIQFKGLTDPWLSLPVGRPSFNLLKIAREGLSFELRTLLLQAKSGAKPVAKYGVFYKLGELQHFVSIQVIPLASGMGETYYLVSFQAASSTGIQPGLFEVARAEGDTSYDAAAMRIEHLERELMQARADMRVVSEEQETVNEKLQSYNEELLSAGEEQQSLYEELETSKEELQSINEEIIIVNKELTERNQQLNSAKDYAEAIVETIRDPLVILDSRLRIKKASKSFYTKFKTSKINTDNALIYEIGPEWILPELKELLERILPERKTMEDFSLVHDFSGSGKRNLLLNARQITVSEDEELILLAIEDVTGK